MIRVMLVDDQEMVRTGFRMLLEVEDDITIVAEASDGAEALETFPAAKPDVILMDIQMPRMDGLAATEAILSNSQSAEHDEAATPKVVVLTTFEEDEYIFEALRLGASGFLLKNAPAEDLVDAIRVIASGNALLHPAVTRRVISSFASSHKPKTEQGAPGFDTLTDREKEVLLLMAKGMTNAEIAESLILGEATIKTHVSSVFSKLKLRDRVQAVVFAFEHRLVN